MPNLTISGGLYKNVDAKALPPNFNPLMMDCYVDEHGGLHRRPGLVELCDLLTGRGVDGIFWWDEQQMAIVVSSGKTFKITNKDGNNSEITGDTFQTGQRVNFDDFTSRLYAANGAKIIEISTNTTTAIADANAPTTVSHIAILDKYLLGNEVGTANCHRSDVNEPTVWGANSFEAEAEADNIQSIGVADLELLLLGTRTLEIWRDDGVTPFIRELQGYVQNGTIAKQSMTWLKAVWGWLDHNRQGVLLEGRIPKIVSIPVDNFVQRLAIVSDMLGDFILVGGRPFWIWSFPSEDVTLVYDIINTKWYQWAFWDSRVGEYTRWRGNCATIATGWGLTLIGDRQTGKVYYLDDTVYQDNGKLIRTAVQTAWNDHGSSVARKRSNSLTFRVLCKNVVDADTKFSLMVKWRDNGSSAWNAERIVELQRFGAGRSNMLRGQIRRLGMYYTRQYEFSITDNMGLTLQSVFEDVGAVGS